MGSCVTFLKSLYYLAAYSSCRTDRVYRTSTGLEVSDSVQERSVHLLHNFSGNAEEHSPYPRHTLSSFQAFPCKICSFLRLLYRRRFIQKTEEMPQQ